MVMLCDNGRNKHNLEVRLGHKMQLRVRKYTNLGIGCVGALGLLLVAMLCPLPTEGANAEETTITTEVGVQPVIGLSAPSSYTVDVTPTETGAFSSSTAQVTVTTNNETGYSLYLATANGQPTLTSAESAATIGAVSGTVTSGQFGANTWGYYLGEAQVSGTTQYQAVPTTDGTPVQTTELPTSGDTYNLAFGAFVNTSLPGGAYSNQVVVSVVANPAFVLTLSTIDNMQDMTSEICAASAENETKQLIDTRDGKSYWVTKLKDGNCWMTQNLDLDLNATTLPLTPATSDVPSNWSPDTYTEVQGTITDSSSYTSTYSWDVGMYVKVDPLPNTECSDVKTLSACGDALIDVSSMSPQNSDKIINGIIDGDTYDAHYLVGNYYQWNTATADTGSVTPDIEATGSICAKGWHLPTIVQQSNDSFSDLLGYYDLDQSYDIDVVSHSPLYFNFYGDIAMGVLENVGSGGFYWTSATASDAYTSESFEIANYGFQSWSLYRYHGLPIRCVAD